MPRASEAGSMLKVASSTSTKTGVAPTSATTSPVAQNVNDGHSTASPGPTFFAISTIRSASEPPALRGEVDEGNGFWSHVLVHGALVHGALRGSNGSKSAGDAARPFARG